MAVDVVVLVLGVGGHSKAAQPTQVAVSVNSSSIGISIAGTLGDMTTTGTPGGPGAVDAAGPAGASTSAAGSVPATAAPAGGSGPAGTSPAPSLAAAPALAASRQSGPSTTRPAKGIRAGVLAPFATVSLPLPLRYMHNGSVDQGVDFIAPGGTPLYAMGPGVILQEGISGFGPNTPVLRITGGPLAGLTVYYGHSGPDLVPVGAHVVAGQQISIVGYGIVGISTAPHLEVGFYPLGNMGAGRTMAEWITKMGN
jgi:murein DD-endopeptidase MepM/ murein hydrolase activator NlpD